MLEVELKFPVPDHDALAEKLRQLGGVAGPPIAEVDHYVNAPDRDFAHTDEALRLRRIGPANRVTYKGPKLDTQTKTRTEVEVALADGDQPAADLLRLLTLLGYRPTAEVRKRRQIWHLHRAGFDVQVCLDDVAGLGRFAELEIIAAPEQLDAARAVLLQLAGDLGLSGSERRSYLQMLREQPA
jgi:adenylate cyclase class 2